jgi:hypothetical protein
MKERWHEEITSLEIMRKVMKAQGERFNPSAKDLPGIYASLIERAQTVMEISPESDKGSALRDTITEYLWVSYGRPTWFIHEEVFEMLKTLQLSTADLTGVFFPQDVFSMVFPYGSMIRDKPLRSIRVFVMHAQTTRDLMAQLKPYTIKRAEDHLTLVVDAGENAKSGICSWDAGPVGTLKWTVTRPLDMLGPWKNMKMNEEEISYMDECVRIVAAAMLYRNAKPDHFVDYTLPRSQRYNFKGDRKKHRRFLMPKSLERKDGQSRDTGRTVAGHYRGWVLRVLRHERYRRNEDGSCKTVLVEPTAVKGGPKIEL